MEHGDEEEASHERTKMTLVSELGILGEEDGHTAGDTADKGDLTVGDPVVDGQVV